MKRMGSKLILIIVVVVVAGLIFWWKDNISDEPVIEQPETTQEEEQKEETMEQAEHTFPEGLVVEDTLEGEGDAVGKGSIIAVHYTGTLLDGSKFDSSLDRGEPFVFVLGGGMVIKGWDEGLIGMKVGGKRSLTIPPDLAYGDRTVSEKIPANSTLKFDVELVEIR